MRSENAPKPPNYSDLFDGTAAVNIPSSSPPSYTSKTPSVELSLSNETVNKDNNKVLQVTDQVVTVKKERVRIIKPKKNKKKIDEAKETLVVKDDDVEAVVKEEENEKTDQA